MDFIVPREPDLPVRYAVQRKDNLLIPRSMADSRPIERQIIFLLPAGGMNRQLFRLGDFRPDVFDMRYDLPRIRPGEP